jgi:hypothetical protein
VGQQVLPARAAASAMRARRGARGSPLWTTGTASRRALKPRPLTQAQPHDPMIVSTGATVRDASESCPPSIGTLSAFAASRMVTSELSAHVEPMARWIIGKAVQRFPANDRNRFREEWLAHLDETPGTLRKLWHAVGCYLGAAKVAGVLAKEAARKEDRAVPSAPTNIEAKVVDQVLGPTGPSKIVLDLENSTYEKQAVPLKPGP